MPKRGRYGKYIFDTSVSLPRSTKYYFKKHKNQISEQPSEQPAEQPAEQPSENETFHNVIISQMSQRCNSKEEISALMLTLFYSGKFTQRAFGVTIKAINMISDIKLPYDFNALSKILMCVHNDEIKWGKKWYCHLCKKIVDYIKNLMKI